MTKPVRLQLSRRKGHDLQELSLATNGLQAVNVSRPSAFGNRYRIWQDTYAGPCNWRVSDRGTHWGPFPTKAEALAEAVRLHREELSAEGPHNHRLVDAVPTRSDIIKTLRGRNLACWCELGGPCHADVLLEIANGRLCEEVR